MPKPMIRRPEETNRSQDLLSATAKPATATVTAADKMKLDRLLRKPRSKKYMDAVARLDAGGHAHHRGDVEKILEDIRSEFPEVHLEGVLIGYVAECHLGIPYEVHTLSPAGTIIEHYERGRALPGLLEKARTLAMRGGYAFIEVYVDCCRAVTSSGMVSVIPH